VTGKVVALEEKGQYVNSAFIIICDYLIFGTKFALYN
jgi:hypothetical protein